MRGLGREQASEDDAENEIRDSDFRRVRQGKFTSHHSRKNAGAKLGGPRHGNINGERSGQKDQKNYLQDLNQPSKTRAQRQKFAVSGDLRAPEQISADQRAGDGGVAGGDQNPNQY